MFCMYFIEKYKLMPRKVKKIHQNIYYNYFYVMVSLLLFYMRKSIEEGASVGGFKDC